MDDPIKQEDRPIVRCNDCNCTVTVAYIKPKIKGSCDQQSMDIKQEEIHIKDECPPSPVLVTNNFCPNSDDEDKKQVAPTDTCENLDCDNSDRHATQEGHSDSNMKIDTDDKPFSCEVCNYKTKRKFDLECHKRIHTREKPFICDVCDFKATGKSSLSRHKRIHTGEKPFVCGTCGFKSAQKYNLREHIRTHTAEKPFGCGVCNFKSAQKSTLRNHMKTHSAEKPFVCGACDFKTAQKSSLMRHIRSHSNNVCGFKSALKSDLRELNESDARIKQEVVYL